MFFTIISLSRELITLVLISQFYFYYTFVVFIIKWLLEWSDVFELAEIQDDVVFVVLDGSEMYEQPDGSFYNETVTWTGESKEMKRVQPVVYVKVCKEERGNDGGSKTSLSNSFGYFLFAAS